MNSTQYLLLLIAEEASEIAQAASKASRFGLQEVNIFQRPGPTNEERLVDELNDLIAVVGMLAQSGLVPDHWEDPEKQYRKQQKVVQFMEYSRGCGALSDDPVADLNLLETYRKIWDRIPKDVKERQLGAMRNWSPNDYDRVVADDASRLSV